MYSKEEMRQAEKQTNKQTNKQKQNKTKKSNKTMVWQHQRVDRTALNECQEGN